MNLAGNLASIALPSFVREGVYDWEGLQHTTRMLVRNLNLVIDKSSYPTNEARNSNMRHRPISIGVQGLADVFLMLGYAFDDEDARELNRRIFANIYWAAIFESTRLAEQHGTYDTYEGSPASKGVLQYDLWDATPHESLDWCLLKDAVRTHGLRNSLLVGLMPTASTASIQMNTECFEPIPSNLFTRRTLTGEHVQLNKHLVKALEDRGLWDHAMRDELVRHRGSVQGITGVPECLKPRFRTAYEIPMRSIIDMSVDRSVYVCQSSSKNLFFPTPRPNVISAALFYSWKRGEKTGSYYIRTKVQTKALDFTVDVKQPGSVVIPEENTDEC